MEMEGESFPVLLVIHRKACLNGHWPGENHKILNF